MRAACSLTSSPRIAALLASAWLASACGPQVEILLLRGESLEAKPEFVRFEFADLTAGELERFGPYSTTGLPGDELARVPPDHDFIIGVIGCKTSEEAACLEPETFIAQGCSAKEKLGRGETKTLEITLHSAAVGATECGITEITP